MQRRMAMAPLLSMMAPPAQLLSFKPALKLTAGKAGENHRRAATAQNNSNSRPYGWPVHLTPDAVDYSYRGLEYLRNVSIGCGKQNW